MAKMGHASPSLALAIYAQAMRRDEGERERLRALVNGAYRALTGAGDELTVPDRIDGLFARA
jgi:hypothetical protein